MKPFSFLKSILIIISVIFIFVNWKISIAVFLVATIFHVIPRGPNALLSVIAGYLMIGGVVYLFINWKIGVALIICSFGVAKFRNWGNKVNREYYEQEHESMEAQTDEYIDKH